MLPQEFTLGSVKTEDALHLLRLSLAVHDIEASPLHGDAPIAAPEVGLPEQLRLHGSGIRGQRGRIPAPITGGPPETGPILPAAGRETAGKHAKDEEGRSPIQASQEGRGVHGGGRIVDSGTKELE
jgi:hypothetical protein